MGCVSCGHNAPISTPVQTSSVPSLAEKPNVAQSGEIVGKSENGELVKLRYYGGGSAAKKSGGCKSCGGGGSSYTTVTTETIMFVSEDSPNSIFKQTFQIGHDYYVTRKQADYLLGLTFRSKAGVEQNKFKEV